MSYCEYCDGFQRRAVLQAGLAGMIGLSLPDLLRLRAQAATRGNNHADTALIYVEMAGGPSQHETFDPKPKAPVEYRGPLKTISTNVPGVYFSELMVEQARIMDKLAVIRSVHHASGSHGTSSHLTQTGYYLDNNQNRDNDMPCIGSYAAHVRGANAVGMPPFVSIPRTMRYGRAAWLGAGYNPLETRQDAHEKDFRVANLSLVDGLTDQRLQNRRELVSGFDRQRRIADLGEVADATDQFTRQAFDLVTGRAAQIAFDIGREDEKTRDRYGMNPLGQNMLLARRLVEHGVTLVTVRANSYGSWDDHHKVEKQMRRKGPAFDRAAAALVNDLHDRGLDRKVIVVFMGEFGRTPRVNKDAGRDHWGRVMSVVLAGGGLPVGQVIGSSDSNGSVPRDRPYRPESILAVLYRHLRIDPSMTFVDLSGRPRYVLNEQQPVTELL